MNAAPREQEWGVGNLTKTYCKGPLTHWTKTCDL